MVQPPEFDATLTSRYECKYLISRGTAEAIRRTLASHMALDPFSAASSDHRYRVLSLYFDTPGLRLYRDTIQGTRNRYKIRLRYYSEDNKGPIFLEVKKRANLIVRKSRERVQRSEATELLETGQISHSASQGDDLREFMDRCMESGARPAVRIRYWREAWESRGVDPLRITFDTGVEHCPLGDVSLSESFADWTSTRFGSPVILEVKFTDLRPQWLDQILRRYQLDKVSVAKYAESVSQLVKKGQRAALEHKLRTIPGWS